MPYQEMHVDPDLYIMQAGVAIYHAYKDDDYSGGPLKYHFTTNASDDSAEFKFDVRDLDSVHLLGQHPPFITSANNTPELKEAWCRWHDVEEPDHIRAIIMASIDAGLLTNPKD
jgi:hypothetical protein